MKTMTSIVIVTAWLSASEAARDFNGKWAFDGDVQGNAISMECDMQQAADSKLTGKCVLNGTERTELEGTTTGDTFKFSFSVQGYVLTYTGTIEGDSVKGDIEVSGATGTFSGKKA